MKVLLHLYHVEDLQIVQEDGYAPRSNAERHETPKEENTNQRQESNGDGGGFVVSTRPTILAAITGKVTYTDETNYTRKIQMLASTPLLNRFLATLHVTAPIIHISAVSSAGLHIPQTFCAVVT